MGTIVTYKKLNMLHNVINNLGDAHCVPVGHSRLDLRMIHMQQHSLIARAIIAIPSFRSN
jgi:hypothetical protein